MVSQEQRTKGMESRGKCRDVVSTDLSDGRHDIGPALFQLREQHPTVT